MLRIPISPLELSAELEAEFLENTNDPAGLGLELLRGYDPEVPESPSGLLETAANTIYDDELILSFLRAAQYLFQDRAYVERFQRRFLEVSSREIRPVLQYVSFLSAHRRRDEALSLAKDLYDEWYSEKPWYGALLATTFFAVGGEVPEKLLLALVEKIIKTSLFQASPLSLTTDVLAIYWLLYPAAEREEAYQRLASGSEVHASLGFARFLESTEGVDSALPFYRKGHKSAERTPEASIIYLRALLRAGRHNPGLIRELFLALMSRVFGVVHPGDANARRLWRELVADERREASGTKMVRKQYYVFLKLVGDDVDAAQLRRELGGKRRMV